MEQFLMNQNNLKDFNLYLKTKGCKKCDLGFQSNINGCCVSRGTAKNRLMIIAEGPGKDEDRTREPLTGPAGQKLDKIWNSVGLNTNDWYITNVILCRPVAPQEYGKQNLTPTIEQRKRCRPHLEKQIDLVRPKLIVALGAVATSALLNDDRTVVMKNYRGKLFKERNQKYHIDQVPIPIFSMLHPAALLHAQRNQEQYNTYRKNMWDDIRLLKEILVKENFLNE